MSGSAMTAATGAAKMGQMDGAARRELADALARLKRGRGVVVRAADLMGRLLGQAGRATLMRLGMSTVVGEKFAGLAQAALARAYDVAILGIGRDGAGGRLSGPLVTASGAISGFAGMAGFVPDAMLTTLVIMREIARIARVNGEDLGDDEAREACLEVFALSGAKEEESELGYFSARLLAHGRPMTMLISQVASRYGVVLGEKFTAQAVPVAGAMAGAALNAAFLAHYRNVAHAHFTIRRLERSYGRETVREAAGDDADLPANRVRDASFLEA